MAPPFPALTKVQNIEQHQFQTPVKKIHDVADVSFFLTSRAYHDIITFVLQLNRALVPRKEEVDGQTRVRTWPLTADSTAYSDPIQKLRTLLQTLIQLVDEVPPDPGPRRFGNVSFRKWYQGVEAQTPALLHACLPASLHRACDELAAYLLGSFGSAQRLDYGTGHELSFLAFLAALWKLHYFEAYDADAADDAARQRDIVLAVFELYLVLSRKLILMYNLEPAGSHGVWGLDDNSFLPYIFGSAQLAPAIAEDDETPTSGSWAEAPAPSAVAKANLVEREKGQNMYFAAIAFIYDVKKGPFWEHSPMLFDISGIKDGWGKINKGMMKMYNAEVLAKFPVVQHFPFGSLFRWETDPAAPAAPSSTHVASQPLRNPLDARPAGPAGAVRGDRPGSAVGVAGTAAPWAGSRPQAPRGFVNGVTQAPWASRTPAPPPPPGRMAGAPRRPMAPVHEAASTPEPATPEEGGAQETR